MALYGSGPSRWEHPGASGTIGTSACAAGRLKTKSKGAGTGVLESDPSSGQQQTAVFGQRQSEGPGWQGGRKATGTQIRCSLWKQAHLSSWEDVEGTDRCVPCRRKTWLRLLAPFLRTFPLKIMVKETKLGIKR